MTWMHEYKNLLYHLIQRGDINMDMDVSPIYFAVAFYYTKIMISSWTTKTVIQRMSLTIFLKELGMS